MKYVMGIDLGTSSTKALLTDLAGHEAGVGHGSYPIRIPQASWAEQDPECWMKAVKQAVAGALRDAGLKGEDVLGIGFSGQMHGVVALDKEKNLLGPAVIHLDQRAAEDLPDLREAAGNLMKEQLLYGQLFRYGTVGVALPVHAFHSRLDTCHLHLTLQDGFIAHDPYHLVNDALRPCVANEQRKENK